MLWNELSYLEQLKVLDKIVTLLEHEDDSNMQDGLMAAVHELKIWSNEPCPVLEEDGSLVVPATDSWSDDDSSN